MTPNFLTAPACARARGHVIDIDLSIDVESLVIVLGLAQLMYSSDLLKNLLRSDRVQHLMVAKPYRARPSNVKNALRGKARRHRHRHRHRHRQ